MKGRRVDTAGNCISANRYMWLLSSCLDVKYVVISERGRLGGSSSGLSVIVTVALVELES
jgi:hypothetical protein